MKLSSNGILVILLVVLSACGPDRPVENLQIGLRGAITYEGRIALNADESLYVEVSLLSSGEPGQGDYALHEVFEAPDGGRELSNFSGKFSMEPDEAGNVIIHLHRSALMEKIKRTFINPSDNKRYEENLRSNDLRLKQSEDLNTLRVVNPRSERISPENEPLLIRRTSKPFTVEGFFTHMGDSSRFEEINTGQHWPVSKLGVYLIALQQYHQLANKKYEPIYLKGVGYSVVHKDRSGTEEDALVFKKILQMTSAPTAEF